MSKRIYPWFDPGKPAPLSYQSQEHQEQYSAHAAKYRELKPVQWTAHIPKLESVRGSARYQRELHQFLATNPDNREIDFQKNLKK